MYKFWTIVAVYFFWNSSSKRIVIEMPEANTPRNQLKQFGRRVPKVQMAMQEKKFSGFWRHTCAGDWLGFQGSGECCRWEDSRRAEVWSCSQGYPILVGSVPSTGFHSEVCTSPQTQINITRTAVILWMLQLEIRSITMTLSNSQELNGFYGSELRWDFAFDPVSH